LYKLKERWNSIRKFLFRRLNFLLYYMERQEFRDDIPAEEREEFTIEVSAFPEKTKGPVDFSPGGFLYIEESSEDPNQDAANRRLKSKIIDRNKWLNIEMIFYRKVDVSRKSKEDIAKLPDGDRQLLRTTRRINLYELALDLVLEYLGENDSATLFRSSAMAPRAVMIVALALRCLIQNYCKRDTTEYEDVAASKVCALQQDEDPGNGICSLMYSTSISWTKESGSGKKKPVCIEILEQNMTATYEEYMKEHDPPMEDTSSPTDDLDNISVADNSIDNASMGTTRSLGRETWRSSAK